VVSILSWVALAAGFTLAAVQYSVRHGRLLLFPTFDDITYLSDAAMRLQHFYDLGFFEFIKELFRDPPHSPYSTLEAFISFLTLGLHDWAPYAGNVGLVLIFLALLNRLARGLRTWHKICLALLLLSFPLLTYAVITCRPDFAAGALTAAGIFMLLARPVRGRSFVRSPLPHKLAAGALFGLAMLAKPSVFPATIAIFVNCLLVAALCDWFDPAARTGLRMRGARHALNELLRACATTASALVLLALPYYLFAGKAVWRYIWVNTFGADADVWKLKIDRASQLRYYVVGLGGTEMLNWHWTILAGVFLAGIIFLLARRRRREWLGAAALAWVVMITYAICTLNQMKHDFLGLSFQVPLIFLGVLALRNMVFWQRLKRQPPWAESLLVIATVSGITLFQWPHPLGDYRSAAVRAKWAMVEGVFDEVSKRVELGTPSSWPRPPAPKRPRVLMTFSGEISSNVLNFFAVQKLKLIDFYELPIVHTAGPYIQEFDAADFVVACDPGMDQAPSFNEANLACGWVPSAAFQDQILTALRARKDYTLVSKLEYPPNHRNFYVFRKSGPFDGLKPDSRVGPVEGPCPQWKLQKARDPGASTAPSFQPAAESLSGAIR
jgi:hypothetical protein